MRPQLLAVSINFLAYQTLAVPLGNARSLTPCQQQRKIDNTLFCNKDGTYRMVQARNKCLDPETGDLKVGYVQFKRKVNKCETVCQMRRRKWARFTGQNRVALYNDKGEVVVNDVGRWIPQCDDEEGHFLPRQLTDNGALCMLDIKQGVDDPFSYRHFELEHVSSEKCAEVAGLVTHTVDVMMADEAQDPSEMLRLAEEEVAVTAASAEIEATTECVDEEIEALEVVEELGQHALLDDDLRIPVTTERQEETVSCADEEEEDEQDRGDQIIQKGLSGETNVEEINDGEMFEKALAPEPIVLTTAASEETVSCADEDQEPEELVEEINYEKALVPEPLRITPAPQEETVSCEDEDVSDVEVGHEPLGEIEVVDQYEKALVPEPQVLTTAKNEETVSCEDEEALPNEVTDSGELPEPLVADLDQYEEDEEDYRGDNRETD